MDRREFLMNTAAGVAAVTAAGLEGAPEAAAAGRELLPRRVLGKTGRKLSIIGFGGIIVMGHEQPEANRIVAEAVDGGVNYFDVAPSYGDGEAEEKLGPALEPFRRNSFLACKTGRRDRQGAQEELDRSLKRLRTDHFDLYQLHGLTKMSELDQALGAEGALKTFEAAKKEGRIRHIGFSAHSVEVALAAIDRYPFDSILFPVNFVLFNQANFGPQVVKKAQEKGMGILALKSMASQPWPEGAKREYKYCWYQPVEEPVLATLAVRFTLSQPITAAVPPGDVRLFRTALKAGQGFKKLSAEDLKTIKARAAERQPIFRLETA
ncbi:MAG TPA: aldo/keto reductase [Armatimonadota bacterium]|jgi:predicted aldo/keto reductase-like oxidoreductase